MNNADLSSVLGAQFSFSPAGGTAQADAWQAEQLKQQRQEYTHFSKVDYLTGKDGVPLSYAQIQTVEQGYQWLQQRHPTFPNEVLMCMSRSQFGPQPQPAPPKQPPVPRARAPKPAPSTFSIEHKQVEVRFDGLELNSSPTSSEADQDGTTAN